MVDLFDMPDEVLLLILTHANPARGIVHMAATCRRLRLICDDDALWRTVAASMAGDRDWIALVKAAAAAPSFDGRPKHGLARLVGSTVLRASVRYYIASGNTCPVCPFARSWPPDWPSTTTVCVNPGPAPMATALMSMVRAAGDRSGHLAHVWMLSGETMRLVDAPSASLPVEHDWAWWEDAPPESLGRVLSVRFMVVRFMGIPSGRAVVMVPACVAAATPGGPRPFESTWYEGPGEFRLRHRDSCLCRV